MDYKNIVYECPCAHYLSESHAPQALPLDYYWYSLISKKDCPFGHDFFYVLISSMTGGKINAYGTCNEFNAYNLVKHYSPLTLQEAQIIFPEMYFTEENYGFKKLLVPGD